MEEGKGHADSHNGSKQTQYECETVKDGRVRKGWFRRIISQELGYCLFQHIPQRQYPHGRWLLIPRRGNY